MFKGSGGLERLRGDLLSLLDDPKLSDVIIKVQNREIHVHASILSCRSSYFAAMFGSDYREKNEGCIEITDFTADTIMEMLRFIYGAKPPELTSTSACELMKAADKYQLNELKEMCEEFLVRRLDSENALYVLYHAETMHFPTLKRKSLDFVCRNMGSFHNREMRFLITRNSPELAEEIFEKLAEKASSSKGNALSHLPSFGTSAISDSSFRFGFSVPASEDSGNASQVLSFLRPSIRKFPRRFPRPPSRRWASGGKSD